MQSNSLLAMSETATKLCGTRRDNISMFSLGPLKLLSKNWLSFFGQSVVFSAEDDYVDKTRKNVPTKILSPSNGTDLNLA